MSDRSVGLVIDDNQFREVAVERGVLQGSLVLYILFAIYLTGVFRDMEKDMEGYITTLTADDC